MSKPLKIALACLALDTALVFLMVANQNSEVFLTFAFLWLGLLGLQLLVGFLLVLQQERRETGKGLLLGVLLGLLVGFSVCGIAIR